ncbi:MAG: tyrosine-type recombinase/integrase [Nitrososphaeraceae archaeon]
MELEQEQQDPVYYNFINSLHSESSKRNYRYSFFRFLKYCNLNEPKELLTIPLADLEGMITKFLVKLNQENKTNAMACLDLAAIRHFCKMNKIKLDWEYIKEFKGKSQTRKRKASGKDGAYSHDQIKKILDLCDMRYRVIVLLMGSCGMRVGAINLIQLKHLQKLDNMYKITVYPGDGEEYFTFSSPECASAIDFYLDYRKRNGENLEPESYLIREQFDINDVEQVRSKGFPIKTNTIKNQLAVILVRAGIRTMDHTNGHRSRHQVKTSHGFRKFFETQLIESDVNLIVMKLLMGHDIKLDGSYYRPTEEFMLSEYEKAIDNLTINEENRLRKKVETLEIEKSKIDTIALKLQLLEKKFNNKRKGN